MSTIMWKGLVSEDYNASGNWDGDAVPGAGDTVIFSPLYNNPVTQNLDQGTTAISEVIVEPGYTADIGSSALYYKATFSKFRYSGGGRAFIDFGTGSGIDPVITGGLQYNGGEYAVHLQGEMDNLSVSNGSVTIAPGQDATATIASLNLTAGRVKVSSRTSTFTSLTQTGGRLDTDASIGTVKLMKGTLVTQETAVVSTSLKVFSGKAVLNGAGTYTLIQLEDTGSIDFRSNGQARTITTLKQNGGTIFYDPDVITITTDTATDRVIARSVSNV